MTTILTNYALRKQTGAGKRLARAVRALAEAGIKVDYVTVQPPELQHSNLNFIELSSPQLTNTTPDHKSPLFWIKYMINASRECMRRAKQNDTKCLIAFTFGGAIPLLSAARRTKKPLVVFMRSDEAHELKIKSTALIWRWIFQQLENRIVKTASKICVTTECMAAALTARHGARVEPKIKVLYNDIPVKPSTSGSLSELIGKDDATVFTISSKLHRIKNVELAIEALAENKSTEAHLLIIGEGVARSKLEKRAEDLGVARKVTFAGWRSDAPSLVAESDVFILPSLTEGMSNSLLEALSADRLCLVSDIPAHRELFFNEGPIFNPHDKEELAKLMARVMSDESYREAIKRESCRVKEMLSFDWDKDVVTIISSEISNSKV